MGEEFVEFVAADRELDAGRILHFFGKGYVSFLFQALQGVPQGGGMFFTTAGKILQLQVKLLFGAFTVSQTQVCIQVLVGFLYQFGVGKRHGKDLLHAF